MNAEKILRLQMLTRDIVIILLSLTYKAYGFLMWILPTILNILLLFKPETDEQIIKEGKELLKKGDKQ